MPLRFATQHVEWFLDGRKTALLLPTFSADRYQEVPGGPWRLRDDGFAHGKPVTAVQHAFRGYVSQEGGLIQLRSLVTREVIPIQVTGIRMVEVDDLDDRDFRELGYTTRDEYWKCGGWCLAGQVGWLLSATLASRAPILHWHGIKSVQLGCGEMISIFLGAGFSAPAGVPLASQLFGSEPDVDRVTRQRLVDRVLQGWNDWKDANEGSPEEYLADLQERAGRAWIDAQWYVGLVIALAMGRLERVGLELTITRHNLNRTTGVPAHEAFWTTIFRRTEEVSVVTTNYDILPERGIRHQRRPRVPRPGFHYGWGPE